MAVAPERTLTSVGGSVCPFHFRNGRVTAVFNFTPPGPRSGFKNPLGLLKALDKIVFQGGDDGRGYRNMRKIAGGAEPDLSHLCI
jgi:hypothetical protein